MKTAIILVGGIRTWDYCKSSFLNTFEKYQPDIFISTYDKQYGHHPFVQNTIGDFDDYFLSRNQVVDMFDGLNVKSVVFDDYDKFIANPVSNFFHENFKSLDSNCYFQYLKFQLGLQSMLNHEMKFEYDVVVKTRCDLIYEPIDLNVDDNSVLVDSGNVFPNDCILISKKTTMIKISDFIMNEFFNPVYPNSHLIPPHNLLHNAMLSHGLNIQVRKMMRCVVRKGNKEQYY